MATAFKTTWLEDQIHRSAGGVHAVPVTLTPLLAKELLERNFDNRSLTESRVSLYASDIQAGRWAENGEPIIVSRDGFLNDGQHRCAAVIKAGRPIRTLIVFGIERETRTTTNQGKAKTAGDYLAMAHLPNANTAAGIARMALLLGRGMAVKGGSRAVTNSAVMELVEKDKAAILRSAEFACRVGRKCSNYVAGVPFGFAHYICSKINQEAADQYFWQIATGEMLSAGDPAFVVRARLATLGKAAREAKAEALFHGWNAYRRGTQRTLIRITGSMPELI